MKKLLKTPARLVTGGVAGTLVLGGLWALVSKDPPGWLWFGVFFLVSATFEAFRPGLWAILRSCRRRFSRTYALRGEDAVNLEVTELIQKAERVYYCGRLCHKVAEAIRDRWTSESRKKPLKVWVWHTNPDFWSTDEELAQELLKLDADSENFRLKFTLYDQLVDTLVVAHDDHFTFLVRWKCKDETEYAVVVRKWPGPKQPPVAAGAAFACGVIPDGAEHVRLERARKSLAGFCRAARAEHDGESDACAFPIIPSCTDEYVTDHMIEGNLKWFDRAARRLIQDASPKDTVAVTWRLHESSMKEVGDFEEWLKKLEAGVVRVERYLVVDEKIAKDPAYEKVVREIIEQYFPFGEENRRIHGDTYTIRYVGKRILDQYNIPDEDLCLFLIGGEKWAQGSVHSDLPRRILRLWFAKSKNIVGMFEHYFQVLSECHNTKSTLDELIDDARKLR